MLTNLQERLATLTARVDQALLEHRNTGETRELSRLLRQARDIQEDADAVGDERTRRGALRQRQAVRAALGLREGKESA